jgi:hypothetical protein
MTSIVLLIEILRVNEVSIPSDRISVWIVWVYPRVKNCDPNRLMLRIGFLAVYGFENLIQFV